MGRQFKVPLDDEVIEKLEGAANRYGIRSANAVAAEVIQAYLDFWAAAKEAEHDVREVRCGV